MHDSFDEIIFVLKENNLTSKNIGNIKFEYFKNYEFKNILNTNILKDNEKCFFTFSFPDKNYNKDFVLFLNKIQSTENLFLTRLEPLKIS